MPPIYYCTEFIFDVKITPIKNHVYIYIYIYIIYSSRVDLLDHFAILL